MVHVKVGCIVLCVWVLHHAKWTIRPKGPMASPRQCRTIAGATVLSATKSYDKQPETTRRPCAMLILAALSCRYVRRSAMHNTPLKHVIYWGIGGAAAGSIPLLCIYASDLGLAGNTLLLAATIAPMVVVWGVAAGLLTHYTWNTGARFVACFLGVVACFLSLLELLVGAFFGPTGMSGALLIPLGLRYPSTLELIGGAIVAGLLYQAALMAVLLVLRQLFRWANMLVGVFNAKGQGKSE